MKEGADGWHKRFFFSSFFYKVGGMTHTARKQQRHLVYGSIIRPGLKWRHGANITIKMGKGSEIVVASFFFR